MSPESTREIVSLKDLGIADRVPVEAEQLDAFCRKHNIREMALFGSVLRDDFTPASDIDLLVEAPEGTSSFDFIKFKQLVEQVLGREVDLVSYGGLKASIDDDVRREAMLL